jgi:hypothetical protein
MEPLSTLKYGDVIDGSICASVDEYRVVTRAPGLEVPGNSVEVHYQDQSDQG